jgi:hypothetical protein
MISNNTSGILLDQNYDRLIEIDLPQVKRAKTIDYNDQILDHNIETYGMLCLTGDWHIGAEGFSINPFNSHIDYWLKHPYIKLGLMGDYIELSGRTGYVSDEVMDEDLQIKTFKAVLKKLKDQIAFILPGNHGASRIAKYTGWKDWLETIAESVGIDTEKVYIGKPQRGVTALIRSGDKTYSLYATHGASNAQNKYYQLERMAKSRRETVLAMGHNHYVGMKSLLYEDVDYLNGTDAIRNIRMQHLVCSGTFMKDASYAEARSYPMSMIGAPFLRFYSSTNEVDMWRMPYRSQYFKGGIASPINDLLELEKDKRYEQYGVIRKCLSKN